MGSEGAGWAGLGGGPVGPRPSRPVGGVFAFLHFVLFLSPTVLFISRKF
jgi:hypothetical protein